MLRQLEGLRQLLSQSVPSCLPAGHKSRSDHTGGKQRDTAKPGAKPETQSPEAESEPKTLICEGIKGESSGKIYEQSKGSGLRGLRLQFRDPKAFAGVEIGE